MIRLLQEWRENLDKNYVVGGVLMDLSKAFDCIPHDLLHEQCMRINNVNSNFLTVILDVPQGSIVGPILSNCFFNDFFYVIEIANAHNFADDNKLTAFANSIQN